MQKHRLASVIAVALLAFGASPATADIILDTSIQASGQGFGAVQRLLTVERTGKDKTNLKGTEMACDANVGGSLSTNSCLGTDASAPNNGYFTPNSLDAVNGPKNSLGDLSGFTNANQIVIIYNPSQEGAKPTTDIKDLTLKFYDSSNNLVIAVDGGCGDNCLNTSADPLYFADTGVNLGNGGTGFALILDATQTALVNLACGPNLLGCTTLAAETTILDANDGPDSYVLANIKDLCTPGPEGNCPVTQNIPEPITLSLFGAGLAGAVGMFRRRKKVGLTSQIST